MNDLKISHLADDGISYKNEKWRLIEEIPSYAVSNIGRIMRIKSGGSTHIGKILKWCLTHKGYARVHLGLGSKRRTLTKPVHYFVTRYFIGEREPGQEVNHKDGNKLNNKVDNLEYLTNMGNHLHAVGIGLYPHIKLTAELASDIRYLYNTGRYSQNTIGKMYGMSKAEIRRIVENENWIHNANCFPESQMLDAIEKAGCLWSLHSCGTVYDSKGLKETMPYSYYIKITRRPIDIKSRNDKNIFECDTRLEAVQRAFLEIVLGVKK